MNFYKKNRPLRFLFALVLAISVVVYYPLSAQAIWESGTPPAGARVQISVGVYKSDIAHFASTLGPCPVYGLPDGLIAPVPGGGWTYVSGTAAPGTVGDHSVTASVLTDSRTIIIEVLRGPQTIAPYNNTQVYLGETITLTPHSTNGNGDIIPAGSTDAPTYSFTSSDPTVATIDSNGVVTPVSVGNVTITISSPENGSYLAASATVTTQVTVSSRACAITSFSINGEQGVISGNTITVTLPHGTDVTNLSPVIAVSPFATVLPLSGDPQDFTNPVTYTVTAQDGTTSPYFVNVVLGQRPPQRGGGGPVEAEGTPPPEIEYEKAVIGNCKEWVTVRSGPGEKHEAIGKVYLNEVVGLYRWDGTGTWCRVLYNDGKNLGWVHGKFIIPQK